MVRLEALLESCMLIIGATTVMAACVGDDPGSVGTGPDGGGPPGNSPDGAVSDGSQSSSDDGSQSSDGGDSGLPPLCGMANTACCAGNTCNGGAQCNGTICVCPMGQTACGTTCVDTTNDVKNCGRCNHDCLGGACTASKCAAYTVTASELYVARLFTDGGRLYWTRFLTSTVHGGFLSVKLDGTDPVTIFDAGATNTCSGAVAALGKVYFLCSNGTQQDLRQCTLPCGAGSSTVLKGAIADASALTADPATGTVYYAVGTPYNQAPNGGIFDSAGNRVGSATQANPVDLAVANGSIFWLNAGTYSGDVPQYNGGVKRASLTSPSTDAVVVTAGNIYFDNGALGVDASNVYYTGRELIENDVDVVVANAAGTDAPPVVFANGVSGYVVSDGTNVFFNQTNTIRYCSRAGGCAGGSTVLANEGGGRLAVDADSVMWVGSGIRRIAKP